MTAPASGPGDTTVTVARPSRPERGAVPLTTVSVTIGDAAADRVLSFEVTITSIVLTSSSGSTFTLFSGSRRVEATHLAGTFLPINLATVPQGTYTKADLTVTDPDVVFIAADNSIQKREDKTFTRTVTINFNPPLTIGSTAVVLNLDLNVAASLLIDTTTNSITINPTLVATTAEANENEAENEAETEPEKGELEHVVGTVTAVDTKNNQFTFSVGQTGETLTVNITDSTKFEIGDSKSGGLAALAAGMQVRLEGQTQSDGKLVATEVEATGSELGAEAEGIITQVTGNPATQLQIIAHDGSGMGISDGSVGTTALLGSPVVVNITDNTKFVVDANMAIDSGKFPFDAQHIKPGQRVEADSETEIEAEGSGGSGGGGGDDENHESNNSLAVSGAIAANKIKLEQQALVGTVSSFVSGTSGSQFVLTVDADSAFALLSGSTTVNVTVLSTTDIKSGVTLPPASLTTKVRVRGLVFFDGTAFQMIALRVSAP